MYSYSIILIVTKSAKKRLTSLFKMRLHIKRHHTNKNIYLPK